MLTPANSLFSPNSHTK